MMYLPRTRLQGIGLAAAVAAVALIAHASWRVGSLVDGAVPPLTVVELRLALGLSVAAILVAVRSIRNDRSALMQVLAEVDADIERIEQVAARADDATPEDSPERLASPHAEWVTAGDAAQGRGQATADFLANMSHDIRTPMNGLSGLVRIVLKTSLTTRQRDYLEKIDSASRSLAAILDDMLDFSKIDAGQFELEQARFDLDDVLSDVSSTSGLASAGKPLLLAVRRDEAVPRLLQGDPRRLSRVLRNLLANAAQITGEGEMVLEASRVDAPAADRVAVRFSIRGASVALSAEARQRLVGALAPSTSSPSAYRSGVELGLALTTRLVERMGGKIVVDSQRDECLALSFAVELCATGVPAGLQPAGGPATPFAHQQLRGLEALVADDNFTARRTMAAMLTSFGMNVVEAEDGKGALRAARQAEADGRPFAVALVDWQLPDMDGFAVIAALRGLDSFAKTATIVVSAYERDHVERHMPGKASQALLQKPVTQGQLVMSLAATMDLFRLGAHAGGVQAPTPPVGRLRGRVLLVDDDEISQLVGIEMLAALGLEVRLAEDAAQALEHLQQARFDLVLMDIRMPGVDGLELTRRIRQMPDARSMPVVAMTASLASGERQRCMAAGMDDYLGKPLEPGTLGRCVAKWLQPLRELGAETAPR